tara:strand:- start:1201 stop:1986 length:786 start_codon:yes stop_codon:yes gene_type:complete
LKYIESKKNEIFKNLKKLLLKSKTRKNSKRFIVQGLKEIILCLDSNYELIQLYTCSEIHSKKYDDLYIKYKSTDLSYNLYKELSYKEKGDGFLAIFSSKEFNLNKLILPKNPLLLVAESPEKPGNIGAILRTADAAGVDAVIIANPKTEIYNPNIIRSSLGTVFSSQIGLGKTKEVINFLKKNKIKIISTLIKNSVNYSSVKFTGPCSIIVGTESSPLSDDWVKNSDELINIPMKGKIDSLNLSVTSAIVIFEALKQRNAN